MPIIDLVKTSLVGVSRLRGVDYVLILVDNGSSDGSGRLLCRYGRSMLGQRLRCLFLDHNIGYAGACNLGFKVCRGLDAAYVAFMNNDAIPLPGSMAKLIKFLDHINNAAGCQGILVDWRSGLIDTAGGIVDEFMYTYMYLHGLPANTPATPKPISYLDGAYTVYRIEALGRVLGDDPYPAEFFAYYEDVLLGCRLWHAGYKLYSVPLITGYHSRSSSFARYSRLKAYLALRNWLATLLLSGSRFTELAPLLLVRETARMLVKGAPIAIHAAPRALRDAYILAGKLRERYTFSLQRVPCITYTLSQALGKIAGYRRGRLKGKAWKRA